MVKVAALVLNFFQLAKLSSIGGSDTKTTVARVMAALLAKAVSTQLNWMGRGSKGKKAFGSLKLAKIAHSKNIIYYIEREVATTYNSCLSFQNVTQYVQYLDTCTVLTDYNSVSSFLFRGGEEKQMFQGNN